MQGTRSHATATALLTIICSCGDESRSSSNVCDAGGGCTDGGVVAVGGDPSAGGRATGNDSGAGGAPNTGSGGSVGGSGNVNSGVGGNPVVGDCRVELVPYRVVDAGYDVSQERLVVISADPHRLRIIDGSTLEETELELPREPVALSVANDGTTAAVAHDGFVSWIDLDTPRLIDSVAVFSDAHDVVLGAMDHAYVFPVSDQWAEIHSVDLAAGVDRTIQRGATVYERSIGALHPGLPALYVSQPLSPSRVERYDIVDGIATSSYRSGVDTCGNLWFGLESEQLYTACGAVVRTSNEPSEDMTRIGELFTAFSRAARHIVERDGRVFVVRQNSDGETGLDDTTVFVYSADTYALEREVAVPCIATASRDIRAHARFAFPMDAGMPLLVLVQADSGSPIAGSWGITVLD